MIGQESSMIAPFITGTGTRIGRERWARPEPEINSETKMSR